MTERTLTIRDLKIHPVLVPLARPLVTRVGRFDEVPLLLIDLETEEGITGHSYLFGYVKRGCACMAVLLEDVLAMTKGEAVAPAELHVKLKKGFTLMGHQGLTTMALAGFDTACWDALAQVQGVPLVVLLGGSREPIRAYNSNGLGIMPPEAAAEEAEQLVADGDFQAIKIRLGRPTLEQDLAAVRAVRRAVGDDVILPCDFNQSLTVMEAIRRGRALDKEDLYWIEEPIAYDDLEGNAKVSREVATPVQLGENFYGPRAMAEAIAARASDYVMPDLQRIGGVTGWLSAAALAEAAGIEMSSHLFPEVSCHLMAVTPTRHWLEYIDWAAPVLAEPLKIDRGYALIPDVPGTGVSWNEDAIAKYAIEL